MMLVLRDNWQPGAVTRQTINSDSLASGLTIPDGVNSAVIFVEADSTSTADYCIRAMFCGATNPSESAKLGAQFKQGDVITLEGEAQLEAFKVINTEASKNNFLQIMWYFVRQ